MFLSENVRVKFKRGNLKLIEQEGSVERRAECVMVIEPFSQQLAAELGEETAAHLFDETKKIREELGKIELRLRSGLQRVTVRHHEELAPIIVIDSAFVKDCEATRVDVEKTGATFIRFNFTLCFDLADKGARNFLIEEFGSSLQLSFQAMQLPLPDGEAEKPSPRLRSRRTH